MSREKVYRNLVNKHQQNRNVLITSAVFAILFYIGHFVYSFSFLLIQYTSIDLSRF